MSDTIQKYKDYVMTGFMKSVVPIVIDKASGATVTDDQWPRISRLLCGYFRGERRTLQSLGDRRRQSADGQTSALLFLHLSRAAGRRSGGKVRAHRP